MRRERTTASHANRLRSMVRLLAAGAAAGSGLSAAQVFGARQFVGRVVDDFIGAQLRCGVGAQAVNLPRKNHDDEQQERLQQKRTEQSTVRENAKRSFAC